jgi:hypothetical protein
MSSSMEQKDQEQQQQSELELELTPELKQAGIVERFAFYSETNAIHILLNHQYTRKNIVFSVDKKDWNRTHKIFEKQLKQKGISKEHILQLLDVLDNNYKAILSLTDQQSAEPDTSHKKQQQQPQRKSEMIAALEAVLAEDDDEEDGQQQVKEEAIIDPSKDFDPYIPNRDYVEFVIKNIKRNVKREDSLVRLLVYAGLTTYSYNPLCIGIRAPTTEGKTYAVIQSILKYFPKSDYALIGSISPKALIRQHGILVDKDNYQPLEPKIKELKKQIREYKDDESKKEDLQQQLDQLYKEAKYLIDLSGKILLFLESPHPDVWEIIKTTLSHDAWEIEHPYVDTDLRTKNIVTRGWPACIFCSAKDESKWDVWPEIKSRFLIFSPNMSQEKYLESNILTFQKLGLPNFIQQQIIISDRDVELARKCILYLKQEIKTLCPIRYDATTNEFKPLNPVWIPFQQYLAEALPSNRGPTMRTASHVGSLLDTVALTKSNFTVDYGSIGEKQVIARPQDLAEVVRITSNMTSSDYSGIPSNKVSFMKEIFILPYSLKTEPDSKGDKEEKIIAVTTKELCDYYKKVRNRGITTDNLKKQFLNELLANDIIGEIKSEIDGRQNIYYPLVELEQEEEDDSRQQKQKITKLSNEEIFDNFLHCPRIKLPRNYKDVPENWLIYEILTLAKYRIDISNGDSDIADVFDQGEELKFLEKSNETANARLTIKDFVSKYEYSDPRMSIRYILKGDFYEFSSKIFGNMIGICLLDHKDSKKLSNEGIFDNLVINDNGSPLEPPVNNLVYDNRASSYTDKASQEDSSSSISQMERQQQQQNIASDDLDGEVAIPDSIYRLGHSDKWACKNCSLKDDKWGMIRHVEYCKGAGSQSKQNWQVIE